MMRRPLYRARRLVARLGELEVCRFSARRDRWLGKGKPVLAEALGDVQRPV
jgi:hypothetical protein